MTIASKVGSINRLRIIEALVGFVLVGLGSLVEYGSGGDPRFLFPGLVLCITGLIFFADAKARPITWSVLGVMPFLGPIIAFAGVAIVLRYQEKRIGSVDSQKQYLLWIEYSLSTAIGLAYLWQVLM